MTVALLRYPRASASLIKLLFAVCVAEAPEWHMQKREPRFHPKEEKRANRLRSGR